MKAAVKIQLLANLKALKLSAMIAQLEGCLRQARDSSEGYEDFLLN